MVRVMVRVMRGMGPQKKVAASDIITRITRTLRKSEVVPGI